MARKPIIGIMVSYRRKRKSCLELYHPFNKINANLYAFTPRDIDWKNKRIWGLHFINGRWKEHFFSVPDAVYNRCYNKVPHMRKLIKKNKCFNLINHFNKWEIYKILSDSGLKQYVPETFLYDKVPLLDIFDIQTPLFLKPIYGHLGNGVYRIQITENGMKLIYQHHLNSRLIFEDDRIFLDKLQEFIGKKPYIIQKAIDFATLKNRHYDLRVLVQKDSMGKWNITSMISRIAYPNFFNTSVAQKNVHSEEVLQKCFEPLKVNNILQSLEDISINAASLIEKRIHSLGEVSVDFGLDKDEQPWIIEINGMPQKKTFKEGITHLESKELIYKRPLEYAYYLSQLKSK